MRKKTVGADRLVAASFSHGFPYILEIKEGEDLVGRRLMKKLGDVELLLQELDGRERLRFTLHPRPPTQEEFWEQAEKLRQEEAAKDIYGVPF